MKRKHIHVPLNRYTMCALALAVILAATFGIIIMKRNNVDAAPSSKPKVGAAVVSQFKFSGATGWWQGATSKTDMALFHRSDGCFTSIQHKTGTITADKAKFQKTETDLMHNGYTITPLATEELTLQTSSGPKKYNLEQSSGTSPPGANKLMGGQEFGYVELSGSYLYIMGYCDTADQLSATLPALQAIKFDETL